MKGVWNQLTRFLFTKRNIFIVVIIILIAVPASATVAKDTLSFKVEHLSLFLSIIGNIIGLFVFYNAAANKKYAAQRDFQELVAGQQKIVSELNAINKLMDDHEQNTYRRVSDNMVTVLRAIDEFKMLLNALIVKVEGQPISGILGKRDNG